MTRSGVVRGGVAVFEDAVMPPEGTRVSIILEEGDVEWEADEFHPDSYDD